MKHLNLLTMLFSATVTDMRLWTTVPNGMACKLKACKFEVDSIRKN